LSSYVFAIATVNSVIIRGVISLVFSYLCFVYNLRRSSSGGSGVFIFWGWVGTGVATLSFGGVHVYN